MVNEEEWILTAEKFRSVLESPSEDCTAATVISPLLEEAIKHYRDGFPPFLVSWAYQRRVEGSVPDRTVKLFKKDHFDPEEQRELKIIFRKWNEKYGFWTLDLNGKRLILRSMLGGSGGVRYQNWLDCWQGFASDPIAHAANSLRLHARGSAKRKKSAHDEFGSRFSSPPESTLEAHNLANGTPRAKRSAKTKAQMKIKDVVEHFLAPFVKSTYHSSKADDGQNSNMRLRHSRLDAPATGSSQHSIKSQSVQTRPNPRDSGPQPSLKEKDADRKSLSSASENRRRVYFSTPEPTRVALSSKRTYDKFLATGHKDIATALKRRREEISQSLPSKRMGEIGLATESTHATAPSLKGSLAALERDSDGSTTLSDTESDELALRHDDLNDLFPNKRCHEENLHQVGDAPSEVHTQPSTTAEYEEPNPLNLLSAHKLSHTFLLITVPPSLDFKIAKLSSCATVNDVTTAILQPFKMESQIDQIDSFRFKFEWLPANACYRTLLIEPDQMSSSFDYVVKRVDKADLWPTESECYLGIDILVKPSA